MIGSLPGHRGLRRTWGEAVHATIQATYDHRMSGPGVWWEQQSIGNALHLPNSYPVKNNPAGTRRPTGGGGGAQAHVSYLSPYDSSDGASKRTERTSSVSLAGLPCALSRHSEPWQFPPR